MEDLTVAETVEASYDDFRRPLKVAEAILNYLGKVWVGISGRVESFLYCHKRVKQFIDFLRVALIVYVVAIWLAICYVMLPVSWGFGEFFVWLLIAGSSAIGITVGIMHLLAVLGVLGILMLLLFYLLHFLFLHTTRRIICQLLQNHHQ